MLLGSAAAAQDNRWVTFQTGRNEWGRIEHQLDRESIRQEGPYKIFWTRIWSDNRKQPMAFTYHERLSFTSQKFAVDCAQHRFGARFIDSNNPAERKQSAKLESMRWRKLEAVPAVRHAVCNDR
jgi:hypothetical protein